MIAAGGYWRGAESIAPLRIVQPRPNKNLRDCPVCKFGTMIEVGTGTWACIDCAEENKARRTAAAATPGKESLGMRRAA